jgi:Zn-dependent protease
MGGFGYTGSFLSVLARVVASIVMILWFLPMHEVVHLWIAHSINGEKFSFKNVNLSNFFDVFGSLCMLFFGYGWARSSNAVSLVSERGEKLFVALSGPVFNFLSAVAVGIVYNILLIFSVSLGFNLSWILNFLINILTFNVFLSVFNLLPVPPFDGFAIVEAFIPKKLLTGYYQNYHIINLILIFMLFFGFFSTPLRILESSLKNAVLVISGLPFIFLHRF